MEDGSRVSELALETWFRQTIVSPSSEGGVSLAWLSALSKSCVVFRKWKTEKGSFESLVCVTVWLCAKAAEVIEVLSFTLSKRNMSLT